MIEEVDCIIKIAKEKKGGEKPFFLLNKVAIMMYIAIANEIKNNLRNGKILDWGCGYGQLSYLLKNRGLNTISFDINKEEELNQLRKKFGIECLYGETGEKIPFPEKHFDAVVSCGVLEHVENEDGVLLELFNILKKNGYLFIFMLPNMYSYTEFIARLRNKDVHPRKYNKRQINKKLTASGFKVLNISFNNMLPKNLTGFTGFLPYFYDKYYKQIVGIDEVLTKIFPINVFSGVYSVICQKS